MTVYVIRDGQLVDKATMAAARADARAIFPVPHVSRMTPFESPVTGAEITSWRARDADMKAVDAFDVRDLGPDHVFAKGRKKAVKEQKNGR